MVFPNKRRVVVVFSGGSEHLAVCGDLLWPEWRVRTGDSGHTERVSPSGAHARRHDYNPFVWQYVDVPMGQHHQLRRQCLRKIRRL